MGFQEMEELQRQKFEDQIQDLDTKNKELSDKLEELGEFEQNKAKLEGRLESLENELREKDKKHLIEISTADRKKAVEIDQKEKDMQRKIKETRDRLKSKTKDQLDSTTKRAIMENEQHATELLFQSKETERLLDRNKSLLEENVQLKRNMHIHKDLENELARRTHLYQKLIKKMQQRQCSDASSTASDAAVLAEEEGSPEMTCRNLASSSEEVERLRRQLEGLESTLQMVRHEFSQYRHDHATLTQLQDQSARVILSALYKLKSQREVEPFPPVTYDENAAWTFDNMNAGQKEYFFRVLLEKLNHSVCGGCFPAHAQQQQQQNQQSLYAATLPALNSGGEAAGSTSFARSPGTNVNFSNFLWSVASTPPTGMASKRGKDFGSKAVQTETNPSDICFQEGIWNPRSRLGFSSTPTVTPAIVCGDVREWGSRARSVKTPRMPRPRRP
eukprot:NODE_495_length_1526_cov_275.217539.p1 GENE.NODE_495_length_1526_cov_275.217539~~NODE_495_length_1526_cov_275.217539.p1  ORF type:complete len:464 (-),score=167.67 NODE_495_length_1526_cov_275.217539:118-1455(-)